MASRDYWPPVLTSACGGGGGGGSYVYTTSGSTAWTMPVTYHSAGSTFPAPRPQTALDWLDAETEAVCKLARAA